VQARGRASLIASEVPRRSFRTALSKSQCSRTRITTLTKDCTGPSPTGSYALYTHTYMHTLPPPSNPFVPSHSCRAPNSRPRIRPGRQIKVFLCRLGIQMTRFGFALLPTLLLTLTLFVSRTSSTPQQLRILFNCSMMDSRPASLISRLRRA
jgi:hypothetical protein